MRAATTLAASAALLSLLAAPALAQDAAPLARNIASTATSVEASAEQPMAVRVVVRDSVQNLIVTSGPKPAQVIEAIDAVFAACRPADGQPVAKGWRCPQKEMTYSALLDVRGVVVALLDAPTPAATASGASAISSFPVTTAGGSYDTEVVGKN